MKNTDPSLPFLDPIRKALMVIGTLLFLLLGSATIAQAGSPQAAHHTHDQQPELKAMSFFMQH